MMERSAGQVFFSILVNWIVGLSPAVILRYAIYRQPVKQWTAILWAGTVLVGFTALFFSIAPNETNTGVVAIWALITYQLLHYGHDVEAKPNTEDS